MKRWLTPSAVALTLLFLVSTMNYADRTVMSVLQESIKHDLRLTDTELGLLGGPIFAIFYAVVGVPVARLAERRNRKKIVAVMITLWSLITACCGLAQSFAQLALLRIGVGAAESGAPPASHSIVADYFPANRRGRALSALQLGVPVGVVVGSLTSGLVAHAYGWRMAFLALAVPGLVLGLVVAFVLREPERKIDAGAPADEAGSAWRSVTGLFKSPAVCLVMAAGGLAGNASHGLDVFLGSFFVRQHHLTMAQVGGLFAVVRGIAGVTGSVVGGVAADHFARRTLRAYALVPGIAGFVAAGLFAVSFNVTDFKTSLAALFAAYFFLNMMPSPAYAAVQNLVGDRVRATAAAVYLFFVTVVGSIAPFAVGFVSDVVTARAFPAALGPYAAACPGGKAVTARAAEIGGACVTASALGIRGGLVIPIAMLVATLVVYLFAARRMGRIRV